MDCLSKSIGGGGARSIPRDPRTPRSGAPPGLLTPLGHARGRGEGRSRVRAASRSRVAPARNPPARALPGLRPPGLRVALRAMRRGGGAASDLGARPHPPARRPCANPGGGGGGRASPLYAYGGGAQKGEGGVPLSFHTAPRLRVTPARKPGEEGPWRAASGMARDPPLACRLRVREGDGGAKGGSPSHSRVGPHSLSRPPVVRPPLGLHAAQALRSAQRGARRGW